MKLKQYRNSRLFLRDFFDRYPIHFFEMRYLHYPETGFADVRTQSASRESAVPTSGLLDRISFQLARNWG
jgi:hypothetical protein